MRRPLPVETLPERSGGDDLARDVTDRIIIDAGLGAIAPEFRACVTLRDLFGLDYAEIAEVLDIPPGTVRSRIARGRAALAQAICDHDSTEEMSATREPPSPTERLTTQQ